MASFTDYLKTYGLGALTGGASAVYGAVDNGDVSMDDFWKVADPADIFGRQAAKDAKDAAAQARADLLKLSDTAWTRQMQGLQAALGSMNNYNGVLSNLYGVPTNYYDPSGIGGALGARPQATARPGMPPSAPAPAPYVPPSTGPAVEDRTGPGHF